SLHTFFFYQFPHPPHLHSFPTRRSSDLSLSLKARAEILLLADARCEMCGRTIQEHPISLVVDHRIPRDWGGGNLAENLWAICEEDRKSTRLNSSHVSISYAVFCSKKKR